MERLDSAPQASLFDQLRSFARRHPDAASLMLLRPIVSLTRNLERKNLDIAHDGLLFLQPTFVESADTSVADFSVYASFFVGLGRRRLLSRVVLDGPTLGYRPATLLPGRDQQDFDVVVPHPIGKSRELLEFHPMNSEENQKNIKDSIWFLQQGTARMLSSETEGFRPSQFAAAVSVLVSVSTAS